MEFTAEMIAGLLGGSIVGDKNAAVHTVSSIEGGKKGALTYLSNPKYEEYIYSTEASIVLVGEDFEPKQEVKATLIKLPDVGVAVLKLLEMYNAMKPQKKGISKLASSSEKATVAEDCYIGDFAVIEAGAVIGAGAKIYPQAYIGDDSVIGDDTTIYAGAKLYAQTVVGKSCILHSGCVIGADGFGFAPQEDGSYKKIPQIGNVVLGDNVEIGANTCIDCATMGSTRIHDGVKLDNLIQVAHNVEIGDNTAIAAQTGISGSTKIGTQCVIGGQVGFVGHIHIADNTKVAAQTGVIGSVKKEGEELMGYPAMKLKDFLRMSVYTKNIEKLVKRVEELEKKLNEK